MQPVCIFRYFYRSERTFTSLLLGNIKVKPCQIFWGGRWRHTRFVSAAACWGLQHNENRGQVHFTSKEAEHHHHRGKNTGSPSGPDTTTGLDASNAYRGGSVRPSAGSVLKRITHVSFASKTSYFTEKHKRWMSHNLPGPAAALGKDKLSNTLKLIKNLSKYKKHVIRTISRLKRKILSIYNVLKGSSLLPVSKLCDCNLAHFSQNYCLKSTKQEEASIMGPVQCKYISYH